MNKPYYENKFKKKGCSCQFYVEINANDANGCYPLRRENWVSQEYLYMLTCVLDTEISPQNNIVKISITFLRRFNLRRKTLGKAGTETLSCLRLFNPKTLIGNCQARNLHYNGMIFVYRVFYCFRLETNLSAFCLKTQNKVRVIVIFFLLSD